MFFVASQVGDKTILMGNQISDFLNQPHNRTLSHRDSLDKGHYKVHVSWQVVYTLLLDTKPSLSPQTTQYFSTSVLCSVLELFLQANMLVSYLAHINVTGFMTHLALSLSSDCFCEKTTMSKSICIILIQSGPIFKHFALEVYKLARMDG